MGCVLCDDNVSDVDELAILQVGPIDFFVVHLSCHQNYFYYIRQDMHVEKGMQISQFRPQLLRVNHFSNQCLPLHANFFLDLCWINDANELRRRSELM